MCQHLQANQVRLDSDAPVDRGRCGLNLRWYDPDGNRLELVQAYSCKPRHLAISHLAPTYRRTNATRN
jgi:hypothetical protein